MGLQFIHKLGEGPLSLLHWFTEVRVVAHLHIMKKMALNKYSFNKDQDTAHFFIIKVEEVSGLGDKYCAANVVLQVVK